MGVRQAQGILSCVCRDLQKAYPKDYPEGKNYAVQAIALERR